MKRRDDIPVDRRQTGIASGVIPARNAFPAHESDYTPLRELAWNEDYECAVARRYTLVPGHE